MGISNKSKKSDKETQSPVLKLFKDMMQKEKHDPEKANLLTSKHVEKKKKKHNAASRSKSGHNTVESSHSERHAAPNKTQKLRNAELDSRTRSTPFQGEKSWVFWGGSDGRKTNSDDTCSGVSCALKKIISTDYACIGCLAILFTISVLVAVLLVYKSIPCLKEKPESMKIFDGERLKRKIDGLSGLRWDQIGKKTFGGKWDEDKVSSYGIPQSMDFGANFQDLSSLVDSGSELSKILDSDKMSEIQSSDRLREFYKKLIETDAQIRNLKKSDDVLNIENIDDRYKTFPDRAKRSLKIFKPIKLFHYKMNKKDKKLHEKGVTEKTKNNDEETKAPNVTKDSKIKNLKGPRNKRFDNTSEPQGFIIEDKKVVIQFKPKYINRKSKCSHVPKESKSHENQLKHPFYQNTQRLDELLDKFLNKNMPEIMTDQLGLGMILMNEKNKCKHPKIEIDKTPSTEKGKEDSLPKNILIENETYLNTIKDNFKNNDRKVYKNKDADFLTSFENEKDFVTGDDLKQIMKAETSTVQNNAFVDLEFSDGGIKRENSATNNYDLVMSISTMMYDNSLHRKTTHTSNYLMDRVPNVRKLLQTDVDDDQNKVRADDDRDAHDEVDKSSDRKKRKSELYLKDISEKLKMNPASVLNPNWKGPMPLYPDELNSMIKQDPIIVNRVETPEHSKSAEADEDSKVESPIHSKDSPSETDEFETDLTDMEYIEDYFHNKYNRLVEMAQAYSDYGVLDGKKAVDKKVNDKVKLEGPDHRVKLSLSGIKEGFKNSIFGRPKKDKSSLSEGFRLEVQPTSATREDNPLDLYRALQKHIKLSKYKPSPYIHSSYTAAGPEMGLIYAPRTDLKTTKEFEKDNDNGIIFSIVKGKMLKSTDADNNKGFTKSVDVFDKNNDNELSIPIGKGTRSLKSITEDIKGFAKYVDINDGGEGDYFDDGGAIDAVLNIRNVFDTIRLKFKREVGTIKDLAMKLATEHVLSNNNLKFKREANTSGATEENLDKITVKLTAEDQLKTNNKFATEDVMKTNITMKLGERDEVTADSDAKPALKDEPMKLATESAFNDNNGMNLSLENVSDFFMMLSKWFSALDGFDINMNESFIKNSSPPNNTLPKDPIKNVATEISFPIYDSDMIENIGHRSRVLFSIDANETEVDNKVEEEKEMVNDKTDLKNNITISTSISPKATKNNKTIVKRNADANLIFWNDIYDDEYGVAIDNFEDNVRDKDAVDTSDFIKVPNKWFRDHFKKIKDGLHKKAESLKTDHRKGNGVMTEKGNIAKEKSKIKSKSKEAVSRRISRNAENPGLSKKTDFAALTANMKKICRKAANDITKAKRVDVRENSKEGPVAASLMQQLVQLMGDLVDYQVQQKTCRTLPPDLQNFLEWLTSTNPDSPDTDSAKYSSGYNSEAAPEMDFNKVNEKSSDHTLDMASSSEREEKPDARSDCLGTLQAVQDLMRQFEDMPDDDKSKMAGVREYLESQIFYLQKQMSPVNDVSDYNTDSIRFRRDISEKCHKNRTRSFKKIKHRLQQKLSNFMKKFGKKQHNKDVSVINNNKKLINNDKKQNNNDFASINNEMKKNNNENRHNEDKTSAGDTKTVREKRNLRDNYYKAVEDAKIITIDNEN